MTNVLLGIILGLLIFDGLLLMAMLGGINRICNMLERQRTEE